MSKLKIEELTYEYPTDRTPVVVGEVQKKWKGKRIRPKPRKVRRAAKRATKR